MNHPHELMRSKHLTEFIRVEDLKDVGNKDLFQEPLDTMDKTFKSEQKGTT